MSAETAGSPDQVLREEAALRRVAMLVAEKAPQPAVFEAVTVEASGLLTSAQVQIAPVDDPAELDNTIAQIARAAGTDCAISVPIVVGETTWGALVAVSTTAEPLAPGSAARLAGFSQLMASAIASEQAREELRGLAEQQGALRRIATLVAEGAEPKAVFTAVAVEAARILGVGAVALLSYDANSGMFTKIFGTHRDRSAAPDGTRCHVWECPYGALVLATGRPARVDDWTHAPGPIAARYRELGYGQAVAAPIIIDGSIWGCIGAYGEAGEILPAGCETRLADFTHLIAAAISNVQARQARDEHRSLAESQGALRRVATLVAQGTEPQAVFIAVAVEAARILGVGAVSLIAYDADTEMFTKIFGTHGERSPVPDGATWPVEECPEGALVLATGRPARVDDWTGIPGSPAAKHREAGFGQAVAAPVIIDGSIWGCLAAYGEADEILPPGCETRLADYTNLMATAIANAQVRDELRDLAKQQGAALRRVATLVAQQASPPTIFNAVAGEASRALRVPRVDVGRYHQDGSVLLLGSTGRPGRPDDHTFSEGEQYVAARVMETGRAARSDDRTTRPAPNAAAADEEGFRSVVGAPIMVEGALWGVIVVVAGEILHEDTETRLTDFTHLVASSISNVQARNNLIASRARIVTASDETRRRIERNLHDGIQARVLALGLGLRAVRARFPLPPEVQAGLDEVAKDLEGVLEEIRVFSQGLHPALLARSGLGPSLRALGRRSPIRVNLDVVEGPRLPEPVETAVYYVVSEALANAAKHSQAAEVSVAVVSDSARVRATVADDGVGGAALARGSGLIGLVDRVEALGGMFALESPVGRGTTISIELPLASQPTDE
jgi:signal transduction histidine kinase/Flp pilus assembly pilin Flp